MMKASPTGHTVVTIEVGADCYAVSMTSTEIVDRFKAGEQIVAHMGGAGTTQVLPLVTIWGTKVVFAGTIYTEPELKGIGLMVDDTTVTPMLLTV